MCPKPIPDVCYSRRKLTFAAMRLPTTKAEGPSCGDPFPSMKPGALPLMNGNVVPRDGDSGSGKVVGDNDGFALPIVEETDDDVVVEKKKENACLSSRERTTVDAAMKFGDDPPLENWNNLLGQWTQEQVNEQDRKELDVLVGAAMDDVLEF